MKKKTAILLAVLVLIPVLSFAEGKTEGKAEGQKDIFKDDPNGLLTVHNETNADMVLFAGNVSRNNVLGGIRAKSSGVFDISKIENVPDEGAFILNAVSAAVYQNKKNLVSNSDILYSWFFSYYNLKDSVKRQNTIPDTIDVTASNYIIVSNNSPVVCVVRINAPYGDAITALRPFEENRKIWIVPSPNGYTIYPQFVGYDNKNSVWEFFVKGKEQGKTVMPNTSGYNVVTFSPDSREILENIRINLLFE